LLRTALGPNSTNERSSLSTKRRTAHRGYASEVQERSAVSRVFFMVFAKHISIVINNLSVK